MGNKTPRCSAGGSCTSCRIRSEKRGEYEGSFNDACCKPKGTCAGHQCPLVGYSTLLNDRPTCCAGAACDDKECCKQNQMCGDEDFTCTQENFRKNTSPTKLCALENCDDKDCCGPMKTCLEVFTKTLICPQGSEPIPDKGCAYTDAQSGAICTAEMCCQTVIIKDEKEPDPDADSALDANNNVATQCSAVNCPGNLVFNPQGTCVAVVGCQIDVCCMQGQAAIGGNGNGNTTEGGSTTFVFAGIGVTVIFAAIITYLVSRQRAQNKVRTDVANSIEEPIYI